MSVAHVAKDTNAPVADVLATSRSFSAHSTGGVVSTTRTLNDADVVCSCVSVARQITSLGSSSRNSAGDDGAHSTGSGPSTASVAVASKATMAPSLFCASATMPGGTLTPGGPSTTVTTKPARPTPPVSLSTAWQWTNVLPTGNVAPDGGLQSTGT